MGVVLGAVVLVPTVIVVAVLIANLRGETLGRWELRGDPSRGFEGEMPYPPETNSLHLYFDAVWVGPKELPNGSIRLELLEDGRSVERSACTTGQGGSGSVTTRAAAKSPGRSGGTASDA